MKIIDQVIIQASKIENVYKHIPSVSVNHKPLNSAPFSLTILSNSTPTNGTCAAIDHLELLLNHKCPLGIDSSSIRKVQTIVINMDPTKLVYTLILLLPIAYISSRFYKKTQPPIAKAVQPPQTAPIQQEPQSQHLPRQPVLKEIIENPPFKCTLPEFSPECPIDLASPAASPSASYWPWTKDESYDQPKCIVDPKEIAALLFNRKPVYVPSIHSPPTKDNQFSELNVRRTRPRYPHSVPALGPLPVRTSTPPPQSRAEILALIPDDSLNNYAELLSQCQESIRKYQNQLTELAGKFTNNEQEKMLNLYEDCGASVHYMRYPELIYEHCGKQPQFEDHRDDYIDRKARNEMKANALKDIKDAKASIARTFAYLPSSVTDESPLTAKDLIVIQTRIDRICAKLVLNCQIQLADWRKLLRAMSGPASLSRNFYIPKQYL